MTVASKLLDHPGLVALCNKGHLPGVNEAVEAVFVNVSNQSAPARSKREKIASLLTLRVPPPYLRQREPATATALAYVLWQLERQDAPPQH